MTAFMKARKAQSIEDQARNFKVFSSSPTKGKKFNVSFCILLLWTRSWQVDQSNTNEIKHDIHP